MRSQTSTRLVQVATIAGLLGGTSAARSADLAPAPPPVFATAQSPWAGLYAGTVYGIGKGSFRSSQSAARSASKWGDSAGVLIGYNFQSGPFVFGPEADVTVQSLRAFNPGVVGGLVSNFADSLETVRLRGRLGYDLGAFLPFVAAGVAFNETYQYNSPLQQFGQTREQTGLTLGAGLEYHFVAPFLGPLILRGEYVYDRYPTQTFALLGGPVRTRGSAQYVRVALIAHPSDLWRQSPSATGATGVVDWSGAYAGVQGGAMWARPKTSLGGVTTSYSASGPEFGAFTGRNFMFGSWMLGYEGGVALSSVTGTGAQPTIAAARFRNYLDVDLRGRAGYAFGRFLPYVTFGGDWGRSEQTDLASGSFRGLVPSNGLVGGGGVEYMLSESWSARAEYLFASSYQNTHTDLDGLRLSQSRTAQTLRLGLAYYFH